MPNLDKSFSLLFPRRAFWLLLLNRRLGHMVVSSERMGWQIRLIKKIGLREAGPGVTNVFGTLHGIA
ncbi:MAG: hypothetical protein OSB39_14375 [Opitutales bacterium]|jgi:hypothetical protein|nr:hypothetical protein [Opitutales bacterium]